MKVRPTTHWGDGIILGPYGRKRRASLNEALLMFRLLRPQEEHPLMVDVGAHFGGSLIRFALNGWEVFAFEPDPTNRQRLQSRLSKQGLEDRVYVDPRAVGASAQTSSPFFASEESTGISSLMSFRDSHRKIGEVDVTTLAAF